MFTTHDKLAEKRRIASRPVRQPPARWKAPSARISTLFTNAGDRTPDGVSGEFAPTAKINRQSACKWA